MEFDIQKANTLKRVSAFILDFILLCVLAVGFAAFISWVSDFDGHYKTFTTFLLLLRKCFEMYNFTDAVKMLEYFISINSLL